ncbi:hypothetical protein [Variovorax sp. Sphag1AA]|uniref:hypothetical protein n=1 Tax=Variovorax sp. Sphag1AA TaxID=2587027 RepID=UPI00161C1334|nr:hypothetical protein [Variovorax sp. Sphag1AA]MBB3180274.1 hypothetical protein [Variovorax sp. Sphag1AA]
MRALNITVSGAHSDIGDTYAVDGLGVLNYNLAAQYINRLSDTPILQMRPVHESPDLYRIHRSEQHAFFYGTAGYDADGLRDHFDGLGPEALCRTREVRECYAKDPMNPELELQLDRRSAAPKTDLDRMIDQLYAASLSGNDAIWTRALESTSQQFIASPAGQAWEQEVQRYGETQRAQEALQQEQWEQQLQLQEPPAHRPHAMQM